jgi:hypothetical protein
MLYFGGGNLTEILRSILFYFGLFCIISVYVGGRKQLSDQIHVWQKQKSVAKKFLAFARALWRFYTRVTSSVWRHSRKLDLAIPF